MQAVLRYNHSMDYVSTVLRWMQSYASQTVTIPDTEGVIPPATDDTGNVDPPVDPPDLTTTTTPAPTSFLPTTQPTQPPQPSVIVTPPRVVPPPEQTLGPKPPYSPPPKPPVTSTPPPTATPTPTDTPTPTETPSPTDTPTEIPPESSQTPA